MTIQLKRKQQGNLWMYMQSNLKQSQNQAEKLKKLSDFKRKRTFHPLNCCQWFPFRMLHPQVWYFLGNNIKASTVFAL